MTVPVDCVVAGFRWHKSGPVIDRFSSGSKDDAGALHQVGVSASFTMAKREELVSHLAPYRMEPNEVDRHPWIAEPRQTPIRDPREVSRAGNSGKDLTWEPLVRSSWLKLPTTTCKAPASATRPDFGIGGPIEIRPPVPTNS